MNLLKGLLASGQFGEDGIDGGSPEVGPGLLIPSDEEALNRGDQFGNAIEGAAANVLVREVGKPALDQVESTATGRHKVKDKTRMRIQPALDLRRAVCAVVVHHHVQRCLPRKLAIDAS